MFSFPEDDVERQIASRDWQSSLVNKVCIKCGDVNWRKLPSRIVKGKVRYAAPRCITCKSKEQAANRARHNASNAKYRAAKKNQTPADADEAIIKRYYERSDHLSKITGIPHSVDHIKPLNKGGLHHQDNIQVIPSIINSAKCDRDRPEVVGERLTSDGNWTKDWSPIIFEANQ